MTRRVAIARFNVPAGITVTFAGACTSGTVGTALLATGTVTRRHYRG